MKFLSVAFRMPNFSCSDCIFHLTYDTLENLTSDNKNTYQHWTVDIEKMKNPFH